MNKPILSQMIPLEDQAAFIAAVREGIEASDAGLLTPFEPVAEWLASWGTEHELPRLNEGSDYQSGQGGPLRISGSTCKAKVQPPRENSGEVLVTPVSESLTSLSGIGLAAFR